MYAKHRPRASGPSTRASRSAVHDLLDDLADRVARLGRDARLGPEGFVVEKLSIAADLRRLAREARP